MESYILTRSMHLGHLKETFGKGAVINFDPETRRLTIDGRRFDDYRDVEILKRQAVKKPHDPWIVEYSQEMLQEIRGGSSEAEPAVPRRPANSDGMEIVQSDEDSHDTIDIRHTQVSRIANEAKEGARNRTKSQDLPVVKGDESVEERIASLKKAKDTDLAARAERVRLMGAKKASMPVVHDDSLGHAGGSKVLARNAGMPVSGRRAEETPEDVRAAVEARKKEVEMNRRRVAEEMGIDPDQAGIDEATPLPAETDVRIPVPVVQPEPRIDHSKEARIAALRAELAQLEGDEASEPRKAKKMPVVKEG
jgi:hypothetical protein